MNIAISVTNPSVLPKAQQLAEQLGLAIIDLEDQEADMAEMTELMLVLTPLHLELRSLQDPKLNPLWVDFNSTSMAHRLKHTTMKDDLIKAIGIKRGIRPRVLDATAGLGTDGFLLAYLGCAVTLIERSPIIAALLADGLQRANAALRPQDLIVGDAKSTMKDLAKEQFPDVVYLDPMHPERNKSALVKKAMRLVRDVVGNDEDAQQLLAIALRCARKRVVVKRPRLASNLTDAKPDHVIVGKSTRYDIYLVN